MTQILTESFCERCGTRYTFEPVESRRKPLSAFGTLGRGIRHFVTDSGSSLDEAFAVARSENEQRSTASAIEAFHRTFNFCLSCRQYTCGDCWNAVEGRCLSCAPTRQAVAPTTRTDTPIHVQPMDRAPTPVLMITSHAETAKHAEAEAAMAAAAAAEAASRVEEERRAAEAAARSEAEAAAAAARAQEEADARAAAELAEAEEVARAQAAAEASAAAESEAQALAEQQAEQERMAAQTEADATAARAEAAARARAEAAAQAAAETEAAEAAARAQAEADTQAEAQAAAETEAAGAAAHATVPTAGEPVLAFEPGSSLDDAIAEYERRSVTPVADLPAVAESASVAESAPIAAQVPDVAAGRLEPVAGMDAGPQPESPPAAPVEPIPTAVGQPIPASSLAAPLSWPDSAVAAAAFEPAWPGRSAQAAPTEAPVAAAHIHPGAARACPSCGLSLSASARFCRRCGTSQQVGDPR